MVAGPVNMSNALLIDDKLKVLFPASDSLAARLQVYSCCTFQNDLGSERVNNIGSIWI